LYSSSPLADGASLTPPMVWVARKTGAPGYRGCAGGGGAEA